MMKSMLNSTMQLSPCEAVISSLPENGIEFGYCGVQQDIQRSFTLVNPTSTQVRFTIQAQEQGLFTVNTTQGKCHHSMLPPFLLWSPILRELTTIFEVKRSF